uniref:Uncharacterized protein n=1 Tax=Globisporangium ultimum (strain ATCC 200006 / CBS 805.95 / DAOM BR144) TaxID=431595 RepID=K3W906_GLOUD
MQSKGRRTVKDELDFLRQHVKDLEDKLAELKLAQALDEGKAIPTVIDKEVTEEEKVSKLQTQLWERIAEHQWDEQQRAIERNAKLKELLEWQLKIVHNLSKTIRKRPFPTSETAHFASKHARKMQRRKSVKDLENELRQLDRQDVNDSP